MLAEKDRERPAIAQICIRKIVWIETISFKPHRSTCKQHNQRLDGILLEHAAY
ncbi:hypothetical protein NT2_25_00060 [Caenibius tardaugens NBRC 16725]|uniref:Uncharacterized protein n=1 Tax=Caenibius tardaugens NBRC 16725 TaxID=1219035 RepID=U2YQC9_9SPHN|nr:hypothetical protein NT2_25_00060 [Caenibius tardaugens NBRC 16725]